VSGASRALSDVLLGLFAVVVVAGSVYVIDKGDDPVRASLSSDGPVVTPHAASPQPTSTPAGEAVLVLAGPDLAGLKEVLADEASMPVRVARSSPTSLLAAGSLTEIKEPVQAVVLEIVAGTKTSVRTAEAITACRKRWPEADVFVVGPLSSADRKSAEAAKNAAAAAHATFLDPVALKWRSDDSSAKLAAADQAEFAQHLADALL
jgi:hypothetical protein